MTTNNQGNSSDDSIPKFFRVYIPGVSGDDLEIPISFNSCLPKPVPRTVTVKSVYGNIWRMILKKCGGEVEKFFLVDGWKRIVKDEVLKSGDFLTFEFDGAHSFNFSIYEHETMCKRIRRSSVQSRANDDATGLDEDDDEDDSEDGDYVEGDSDAYAADDDDDDYAVDNDVAEDDGDDYAVDNDAFEDQDDAEDCENPSFSLTLKKLKKGSQLHVPARIIKDFGLNFPESVTIIDPLVKKFGTLENKVKTQTNGSVFVKGFSSIVRRNKVKATDKIICEIKKMGNHNLVQTIKIHIIRE